MQKYIDDVLTLQRSTAGVLTLASLSGISVIVRYAGLPTYAPIYTTNSVLTVPIDQVLNPVLTNIAGQYSFYAPDGRYDLTFIHPTLGIIGTLTDVLLQDSQASGVATNIMYADVIADAVPNVYSASFPRSLTQVVLDGLTIELDTAAKGSNALGLVNLQVSLAGIATGAIPVMYLVAGNNTPQATLFAAQIPRIARFTYSAPDACWILRNTIQRQHRLTALNTLPWVVVPSASSMAALAASSVVLFDANTLGTTSPPIVAGVYELSYNVLIVRGNAASYIEAGGYLGATVNVPLAVSSNTLPLIALPATIGGLATTAIATLTPCAIETLRGSYTVSITAANALTVKIAHFTAVQTNVNTNMYVKATIALKPIFQ